MRYLFFVLLLLGSFFQVLPTLAAIPLSSNTEAECSSEGGTCSINDRNCFRLNTTPTSRYDPIGYCDGAGGSNACCKVGATATGPTPAAATPISTFNYETLEDIPGTPRTANSGDFGSYLQSLYRFTFFGIGIAALFMLTVGGFMYVTSAGNTSRVETAKTIITDSFLGILIALFAWLFLYVINPDLVQRMPVAAPLSGGAVGGGGTAPAPAPAPGGTTPGSCQVAPSGPCSVSIMQASCWGARNKAESASKVCMKESSNNPAEISKTDLCLDLKGFSVGLFQINLIANGYRIAPECRGENVFTLGDGTPMPPSLVPYNGRRTTQANPYTPGRPEFNLFNCKVRDQALYNSCLSRAIETRKNIELGCTIYDAQGWGAWPYTYERVCGRNL